MEKHNTLHFEFTIEESNTILNALSRLPFMEVYKLIEKIHLQASDQKDMNGPGLGSEFGNV